MSKTVTSWVPRATEGTASRGVVMPAAWATATTSAGSRRFIKRA